MKNFTFAVSQSDLFVAIVITSGVLAGWFSYLVLFRAQPLRLPECVKSLLFGIVFSFVSTAIVYLSYENGQPDFPGRTHSIVLWCVAFLPSLALSLLYGLYKKKNNLLEFQ